MFVFFGTCQLWFFRVLLVLFWPLLVHVCDPRFCVFYIKYNLSTYLSPMTNLTKALSA